MRSFLTTVLLMVVLLQSCKKDGAETIPDNDAPPFDGIPTILVENYLNRLYIDLVGREPSEEETQRDLAILKEDISTETRKKIIQKLQTDKTPFSNFVAYNDAYYERLYELWKARLLESVSDQRLEDWIEVVKEEALADSAAGDTLSEVYLNYKNLKLLVASHEDYKLGTIGLKDVYGRMLNNPVYDEINMNTFNFVRASFSDLLLRFPTQEEFDNSFNMIEFNKNASLFGKTGVSKADYITILINSQEYFEGMIRWSFSTFLAREAYSSEVYGLLPGFMEDNDLPKLHREILSKNEYAGFK